MGNNSATIERGLNAKVSMINNTFKTNEGFIIKVIDYKDRHNVIVEFQDEYKYTRKTTSQNIKNGEIKNPYKRTVYNVGYYGDGKYTSRIDNRKTIQYVKWFSMFNRCYDDEYHKKQPSYIGCSVDTSFHSFQDFGIWFDDNWYEFDEPLELDKDLLVNGNKVYSKDTCCFIPKKINNALKYKKNDIRYMRRIFEEYKDRLPTHIIEGLRQYI